MQVMPLPKKLRRGEAMGWGLGQNPERGCFWLGWEFDLIIGIYY